MVLKEMLSAFLLLFPAEFGDKTQLLSLTLAARYGLRNAVGGVFLATALLQAAAVLLGSFAGTLFSGPAVKIVASGVFIAFGIFMLLDRREESCDCEKEGAGRIAGSGSLFSVAALFILAELGDKTQLVTIALAAAGTLVWAIWAGAVLGMFASNMVGMIVGRCLGSSLPPRMVKIGGGILFIIFGIVGLVMARSLQATP